MLNKDDLLQFIVFSAFIVFCIFASFLFTSFTYSLVDSITNYKANEDLENICIYDGGTWLTYSKSCYFGVDG